MSIKKEFIKVDSLLSILELVEQNVNSVFLVNPPVISNLPSIFMCKPEKILNLYSDNVEPFFDEIDSFKRDGYHVVTLIDYEAGYLFSKKFEDILESFRVEKLGRALVYNSSNVKYVNLQGVQWGYEQKIENCITNFSFNKTQENYSEDVLRIKERIKAGDTYQINYTMTSGFKYSETPAKLFATLLFNQTVKYSAFINAEEKFILSLSPELFFRTERDFIHTAPMKGTIKRESNPFLLKNNVVALTQNPKERAENLMITDLLRNDLHKICTDKPLAQISICRVQLYETVLQMISEIKGHLPRNISTYKLFEALFPCGSITGAPKISSMKIINELEGRTRGIYTGSIGYINQKESSFNVAIRTIEILKKRKTGKAGLGGGIVWDSEPESEYEECILKGNFITKPTKHFRLFETMLIENDKIPLLDHHIERIIKSAKRNYFYFNKEVFTTELIKSWYEVDPQKRYRLKLLLGKYGGVELKLNELAPLPSEINIAFSSSTISTEDRFIYSKTTNRALYDSEREIVVKGGLFDLIYLNEFGQVCEGGITNIFLRFGSSYITPPLKCGLLEGIGRKIFMQNNPCKERIIYKQTVQNADEIILTNALRGRIKVDNLNLLIN
jgi:para-aminobenzoate synthetase/4-amino-4-deoxychorismate lyase